MSRRDTQAGPPVPATSAGFTVVVCGAGGCHNDVAAEARSMLRAHVRTSRHGMLVVSGCNLSPALCRFRAQGPVIVVQPCEVDRRPTSPLVRVGPLRTSADVVVVRQWLYRNAFAAASN